MTVVADYAGAKLWQREMLHTTEPRVREDTDAPRLNVGAKLTAVVLLGFRNSKSGKAYPSVRTLAFERNAGEKTVRRHLADLERCGFLTRADSVRRGRPVQWLFTLPERPSSVTLSDRTRIGRSSVTLGDRTQEVGSSVVQGDRGVGHPARPTMLDVRGTEYVPTSGEANRSGPVQARAPGSLALPGAGLRLDGTTEHDGHTVALLTSKDRADVDDRPRLWAAVRVTHPGCKAEGCAVPAEPAGDRLVIARPSEAVGGLVEALRAAGVDVSPVAA